MEKIEKETIEDLLDILNISVGYSGYSYWIDAIMHEVNKPEKNMIAIYKYIAKKYNVSKCSVERAMRTSYIKNRNFIQKYFNVNYEITPKILLSLIVREIRRLTK